MSQADELLAKLAESATDHIHTVVDDDSYLVIDPDTRTISNASGRKIYIMQGDHKSERITFELPRYIDGHDMTLCNRVRAHYINIEEETKNEIPDLHEMYDLRVNPDKPETVICSWLIQRQSTQLVGILAFLIQFECVLDDGTSDYEWHTNWFSDVEIMKGGKHSKAAVSEYSDVLEQWHQRIFGTGAGVLDQIEAAGNEQINKATTAIQAKGKETLDSIPADYTETYRMAEEALRTKADAIAVKAEGNPIVINDASDDHLLGLKIFGKTEQVTTKGYQLFEANVFPTTTANDVRVTNNKDGSFTISGAGNGTAATVRHLDLTHEETVRCLKAGTINLKCNRTTNPVFFVRLVVDEAYAMQISNATSVLTSGEITQEMLDNETSYLRFSFYYTGSSVTYTNVKPMVYQDGDGTWEPYSGVMPAPNPNYPQELKSAINPEVDILVKNLANINFDEWFTSGNYTLCNLGSGGLPVTVSITDKDPSVDVTDCYFGLTDDPQSPSDKYSWVLNKGTVAFETATRSYRYMMMYPNTRATFDKIFSRFNIQIEYGEIATDFEEFTKQTLTTQRKLSGIGNVYDELVYDFVNNKWQMIQRIGEIVLDGSEDWRSDGQYIYMFITDRGIVGGPGLCSHMRYKHAYAEDCIFVADNIVYLGRDAASKYNVDVVTWANFLAANPITVQYALTTPIVHDLTTEEVLAFKALHANKTDTVIQNGVGAHMEAVYSADTKAFLMDNRPLYLNDTVTGVTYQLIVTNGKLAMKEVM